MKPFAVERLWVLVHQPGSDSTTEVILAGPEDAGIEDFVEILDNLVRHVSLAFKVDEGVVWGLLETERHRPDRMPAVEMTKQ